jgi:hypothetical protein
MIASWRVSRGARAVSGWSVLGACALAIVAGLGADPAAPPAPPSTASAPVPLMWMPPGSDVSPVPSEAIFPPQSLTVHFDHRSHAARSAAGCAACHGKAGSSRQASDSLLPTPTEACDRCHGVDHRDQAHVTVTEGSSTSCGLCHDG